MCASLGPTKQNDPPGSRPELEGMYIAHNSTVAGGQKTGYRKSEKLRKTTSRLKQGKPNSQESQVEAKSTVIGKTW
jgi:hypothetical protein